MTHLSEEVLAGIALEEPDLLTRRDRLHLRWCRHCAAELAQLRRIVATGRSAQPYDLRQPRPGLLAHIQAELARDAGVHDESLTAAAAANAAARTQDNGAANRLRRRSAVPPTRRLAAAATAAAAVIAVSVGGVVWFRQTTEDTAVVRARATLAPLPTKSGDGTAELVRKDGVDQLSVDVNVAESGTGFEELWLINTDGQRMISLGVLPPDGRASYPVPTAAGGALDGYTIVDISLEPFDGNAAHSRNSLLRGTLG